MAAAVLIDGRGAVLKNRVVTIRNGKIERIAPRQPGASVTYDLGNRTLLPGFIDTHVHMDSHFGVDGRAENRGETQLQRLYAAVDNAYATVAAGYTTAQSIGSAIDADLRKVIEAGDAYGPRLVTSLGSFSDTSKSPAQVREWVRAQVAASIWRQSTAKLRAGSEFANATSAPASRARRMRETSIQVLPAPAQASTTTLRGRR